MPPKAKKPAPKTASPFRVQNVETVAVADLIDHPSNFRVHEEDQAASLESILKQIGWYGRPIVYKTSEGKYQLVDGHLRTSLLRKYKRKSIEVLVVDFTPKEGLRAIASHDPIADLAAIDAATLKGLLDRITLDADALREFLLEDLPMVGTHTGDGDSSGDGGGGDGPEVSGVVKYRCPRCGHKWERVAKAVDDYGDDDDEEE